MTVLALDLGTNTGWAVMYDSSWIESGSVSFATKRHDGGGMKYLKFRRWLDSEFKGCVSEVYFEEVRRHVGTSAAHAYGAFVGQLTAWCEEHSIPYSSVPVGVIKKSATGKGNASKQQMIDAMFNKGYLPEDDNEADALALLEYVCESNKH